MQVKNVTRFLTITLTSFLLSSCANMQAMLESQAEEQKEIADFFWENGSWDSKINYQIAEGDLVATRWEATFSPSSLHVSDRDNVQLRERHFSFASSYPAPYVTIHGVTKVFLVDAVFLSWYPKNRGRDLRGSKIPSTIFLGLDNSFIFFSMSSQRLSLSE